MNNSNIGIVNLFVSEKFKDLYFNESLLSEAKETLSDLFETIKNSPVLKLEFKVFSNLENKYIPNETLATRFIDNNINLFEVYTLDEIEKERQKIGKFINEDISVNKDKYNLYCAIDNVIVESLKPSDEVDVDQLHESFSLVLEHIRQPKSERNIQTDITTKTIESINEEIIQLAVKKFNEKYKHISEDDKQFIKSLAQKEDKEKIDLFEEYKSKNLKLLENLNDKDIIHKKHIAIEKINKMDTTKENLDENIIKLYELNKGLI